MTIGPIDSGAHDPDLVEQVLSIMLLQERPERGAVSVRGAMLGWTLPIALQAASK